MFVFRMGLFSLDSDTILFWTHFAIINYILLYIVFVSNNRFRDFLVGVGIWFIIESLVYMGTHNMFD